MLDTYCYYCPRCQTRRPVRVPSPGKAFAEPACSKCVGAQMMRRYATTKMDWPFLMGGATEPSDMQITAMVQRMPPLPPPGSPPTIVALPKLNATEVSIYSGQGLQATRGKVLYKVTENLATMLCNVYVNINALPYENEATTARVAFHNGLLKGRPVLSNSLVHPPFSSGNGAWSVLKKNELPDGIQGPGWATLPDPLEIGIAIGDERFGLIHLLGGHSTTINTFMGSQVGRELVFRLDKPSSEDTRINATNGLQALLGESFGTSKLVKITHGGGDKFILKSQDGRKLVIDKQGGAPLYTVTTLYGTDTAGGIGGTVVWRRN